jgi:hypothetical protein
LKISLEVERWQLLRVLQSVLPQEVLLIPMHDPVLGSFRPSGKPQMFGRQAMYNTYAHTVLDDAHANNPLYEHDTFTSKLVPDLGLIDWRALNSPISPLLAAVGLKV